MRTWTKPSRRSKSPGAAVSKGRSDTRTSGWPVAHCGIKALASGHWALGVTVTDEHLQHVVRRFCAHGIHSSSAKVSHTRFYNGQSRQRREAY